MSNTVMEGNEGFKTLQHLIQRPAAPEVVNEPSRYPLCMTHPDHAEAVPDEYHEKVVNREHLFGPGVERWKVPGSVERYPHRLVRDEEEEAAAMADGYRASGVVQALGSRQVPEGFKAVQYPKWIESAGRAVNNEAEELALMSDAERAAYEVEKAARAPTLVECGGDVERYTAAVMQWTLAQQAKPTTNTQSSAAAARAKARVSLSRWQALIDQGYLLSSRQIRRPGIGLHR